VIGHDRPVNSVAISPDGKYAISGSGKENQEGRAQIWDLKSGAAVGPPIEHGAGVMQVAYSPTGAFVATASLDKTARIIEPSTGRPVHILKHPDGVWCVAFSHDGSRLVTGCSDENARPVGCENRDSLRPSIASSQAIPGPGLQRRLQSAAARHAGRFQPGWEIAGDCDLEQTANGMGSCQPLDRGADSFSGRGPAGGWVPSGRSEIGRSVRRRRLAGPPVARRTTLNPTGPKFPHRSRLTSICASPDGKSVLTTGDQLARLWNAESGEEIGQAFSHSVRVTSAHFLAIKKRSSRPGPTAPFASGASHGCRSRGAP